jgi:hypothetical protein
MNCSPGELRFLLVLLVRDGADMKALVDAFYLDMSDDGDTKEDVIEKIARVRANFEDVYVYAHEMGPSADGGDLNVLPPLNEEQEGVCQRILRAVRDRNWHLMFLQGASGTGKTFTVRRLIQLLHAEGKR